MRILYVTSNDQKFEEASHILSDWTLERVNLDLTEIQGSAELIASHKALDAYKQIGKPVIVEDVSMSCHALNGLPGPYIKDFLKTIGDEGLAELIQKYSDHRASVTCTAAYAFGPQSPIICQGTVNGTIVPPKGPYRHGKLSWNPIFQPEGLDKTMGELTIKEHAAISMRKIALEKLAKKLQEI